MSKKILRKSSSGFALVEALLVLVIIAIIAGVGAYVLHQKNSADATLSSEAKISSSQSPTTTASGTSASIDKLTQQDSQNEASVDSSSDGQIQQTSTSDSSTVSSVGSAYNENNL
ncbi:MAG: hypothetical protein JWM81_1096 [Candidatus Saccharibacteria bacterium]|nr:hypothetical protein [Candidatus Saccharibacteria bacterium]